LSNTDKGAVGLILALELASLTAPVSGREVGRVFQSEGSCQDRGPKESSEGVGVDKMRLGPDDVNLQTEELHCNYSVLIVSAE